MRSSSCNSSSRPLFTRSSTTLGLSVRIIFASIRCLTVWRARYPTYSREKIIDLLWNIAHGAPQIVRRSQDLFPVARLRDNFELWADSGCPMSCFLRLGAFHSAGLKHLKKY